MRLASQKYRHGRHPAVDPFANNFCQNKRSTIHRLFGMKADTPSKHLLSIDAAELLLAEPGNHQDWRQSRIHQGGL